jgi:hypothetical protein
MLGLLLSTTFAIKLGKKNQKSIEKNTHSWIVIKVGLENVLHIFWVSSDHPTISAEGSETHGVSRAPDKDLSRPVEESVTVFDKMGNITKNGVRFQSIYSGSPLWIFIVEEE